MAERWFRSGKKERLRTKAALVGEGVDGREAMRAAAISKDAALELLCRHCLSKKVGGEEEQEEKQQQLASSYDEADRGDEATDAEDSDRESDAGSDVHSDTSEETDEEAVAAQDVCPRCGGRLTYTAKQTRSADEGMTTFIVCGSGCGYVRRE